MSYIPKFTSPEVATSACFLQNAACPSCHSWKKQMLTLLVSMLCASCGSSGVPTESEATSELQGGESITALSTSDSIIGPGFSGFSVAEAQTPEAQTPSVGAAQASTSEKEAAAVLVAEADTDVVAPGLSVLNAAQELGSPVTDAQQAAPEAAEPAPEQPAPEQPAEIAVVPEADNSEEVVETEMSPEAQEEMAALEADLAELEETSAVSAPDSTPEPEQSEQSSDSAKGTETVSTTVSYDSIKANGLGNGTYPSDDYYLAEYLYQNPDVCFWEQDSANKTITSMPTPVPPEDSIYMPSPTGGDDTAMLEAFFQNNAGKSVVGQGTYKIKTLDIWNSIDIYNMPMVPAPGAKQMVRVNAPDVRIFNSPVDGQNLGSLAFGFNVEDGAHRFVLVNSGVKNIYHTYGNSASAVFIHHANDFYIVCNDFENVINHTSDRTKIARANSLWLAGRKGSNLTGGLIANNYSSNHQSNGNGYDAEFFAIQSFDSVSETNPVRIFANRAYNAGKRMTKNQESNTIILSNYVEWNTKDGPLGRRQLEDVFSAQYGSNIIVRNNRISISAEGHFQAIFLVNSFNKGIQDNLHFDSNDIEIKDNRDPNANSGPELLRAASTGAGLQAVGYEATNSSANNNVVYGTGSLRSYYFFRDGYDDGGGRFEHKNNDISVPYYQAEYRRFYLTAKHIVLFGKAVYCVHGFSHVCHICVHF